MIPALLARLESTSGPDIDLDCAILEWLETVPEIGKTDRWLRHCLGMVGCLSGAKRLLEDLFPEADFMVGTQRGVSSIVVASVSPAGSALPYAGMSRVAGAALVAAILRAYQARQVRGAPRYAVAAE